MTKLFKKVAFALLAIPMIFVFLFNSNEASAAEQSGQVMIDYHCDALIPFDMELTLNFKAPQSVKSGEEFYIQTQTSSAPDPGLADLLRLLGAIYVEGESLFTPNVVNGTFTPTDLDLDDRQWTPINRTDIPAEGGFTTTVPADGPGELGPFVAEAENDEIKIYANQINTKLFVYNSEDSDAEPLLESVSECHPLEGQDLHFVSITIDDEAPVITINGNNPMEVKQGDPYEEFKATAEDNVDGNLTDQIEISGEVDTSTVGTYTVTYTVSDSAGNVATAERTVNVVEAYGFWYTGEGEPSDELGNNGDSYLDLITGDLYKRDSNSWNKIGNLKGADGAPGEPGTKWYTGDGKPNTTLGNIGDLYLNNENGDVYEKTADGWKKIANLEGPTGPAGPPGDSGSKGDSNHNQNNGDSVNKKGDHNNNGKKGAGGKLPKTATHLPTLLLFGALLTTVGGILFLRRRKAIE
ncbi:immunoglobulin-like domain-containing protein [Pueribacillus sp. YX66]|uniref:immunoglobulin-like domain-containing protein n=1 Tax=Pueribacillus sp. YX66 TaxID=3229242 RepID=UPI00358D25E4